MLTKPATLPFAAHPKSVQRGTTLIEILVTLILISVGLLGIAALQLTSLRGNQEAYVRSQASALAGDILDRMRGNQNGVQTGEYRALGATTPAFNDVGTPATPGGTDMVAWQAAIDELLPGADPAGSVGVSANGRVVTVVIQWDERGDASGSNATKVAATTFKFRTRSEI